MLAKMPREEEESKVEVEVINGKDEDDEESESGKDIVIVGQRNSQSNNMSILRSSLVVKPPAITSSTSSSSSPPSSSSGRGPELMRRLCLLNPQFASSVLEDYIRPVVRDEDVILEIECGANAALLYLSRYVRNYVQYCRS